MLGHETILDKFDSTEIISSILSTRMVWNYVNYRRKNGKAQTDGY